MLPVLFPSRFSQWVGPLVAATAAAILIAAIVIGTGFLNLSAARPDPEGMARIVHFTFKRSTAAHADAKPPADLDTPTRIAAGAAYYGQVCARCHGGPGLGQNPVVMSMNPRPQYLTNVLKTAGYSAPELFRIVKAGVKYTAMPAWPATRRDDEVWHMVAFLRALPTMSPATFQQLALVRHDGTAPAAPFGAPAPATRYALRNDSEPPVTDFAYATPVFGFSGFAQSADPAATCAHCHGEDGRGGGAFPNLTIQPRNYIARTLEAYAAGRRRSGFMQVMAAELSPAQIGALADHYAALPRQSTETGGASPALGQQIALTGLPSAGLAPCASCHGIDRAAAKAYPPLEGQSRWYVANQMRLFRAGGRGSIVGDKVRDPMVAIARRLNDQQIEAVAAYYASRPPALVQSFAAVK